MVETSVCCEDGKTDIELDLTAQDNSEQEKIPLRSVFQGTVLILISNLIYISNNYAVAWTELKATEIALVRGTLQVIVFGVIVWREKQGTAEERKEQGILITLQCQIHKEEVQITY